MNSYSCPSMYQEQKFLNTHTKKVEQLGDGLFKDNRVKVIAIMLDVQGTIDEIDDEKAKTFMKQLHQLRIKYGANQVIINLSSHMHTPDSLIQYLEILHRNLTPHIILDSATYLYGEYKYETGVDDVKGFGYNLKKTELFENKYFGKYNVLCHGIIDDSVSTEYLNNFKDKRPVFILRPSGRDQQDLKRDNLMCHSTLTEGFDGVLECLDSYLESIKDIPAYDMVRRQSNELVHLSAWEVKELCINKEFDLIFRYVIKGKLDDDDYERVARELGWCLERNQLSILQLSKVSKIIEALSVYLHKDNEYLLSLSKRVKNIDIK